MGKILLSALFALLAINFLFASCPKASRSINLAAVTGENSGGVFLLEVETRPGNGTIYTSILPRVGFLTQESQEAAVNYAFSSSGFSRHECDVLFKIKGNFGENSVDGPSAGGAMAVALRAALLNKTVRQDVVMTGSLLPDGKIGEVGGVIEKGIGVAEAGA
ncbi:MAG: S16 family serine protease, partial [Candidatus Anstonellaceae archaeon]